MMRAKRRQRIILVGILLVGVSGAATLALLALRENINLFFSPSDVVAGKNPIGTPFRIGGMVVTGSVRRGEDDLTVSFVLTDTAESVKIVYSGILPDLFREGQGIVAQGSINNKGVFIATQVLAKHDENYMPPEVKEAMEKAQNREIQ